MRWTSPDPKQTVQEDMPRLVTVCNNYTLNYFDYFLINYFLKITLVKQNLFIDY